MTMADDDAFPAGDIAAGLDLEKLLSQAQAMQEQLMAARDATASQEVVGQSGGGAVKVTVTGGLDFTGVRLDPAVVDPADIPMLEDLVLAAVRDAVARAQALSEAAMGDIDLGKLGGGLLG